MDYADIKAVNASTLKWMQKSPRHFQWARTSPGITTPSTILGTATHCAVLEPDRFVSSYVPYDGDRRGKAYAAFCEEHPDRIILKQAEWDRCIAMRDAVRLRPDAAELLAEGEAEVVLTWTDEETGLPCKGRLDFLCALALVDLKTAQDIDPIAFGKAAHRYQYPLQFAFYSAGLKAARGLDLPVKIIAVESGPPYDVGVFSLSDDDLYLGETQVRKLLRLVAECEAKGEWPGQVPAESPLVLPPWAFQENAEDDAMFGLTGIGEEAA